MPTIPGTTRRPTIGRGATRSTSISFLAKDLTWLEEQAQARNVSLALVVGEAVTLYRAEMDVALDRLETEARAAKRTKLPDAPAQAEDVEL